MRRLLLLSLVLAASVSGVLSSPPPATAADCVTYCTTPDACGHYCCYMQCCGKTCVFFSCAPPPPCEIYN